MKNQIKASFPIPKLTKFDASDPSIHWEEKAKEFSYNGKMYDVVRTEKCDGKLIYYCLSDKDEDQLNKTVSDLVNRTHDEARRNYAKCLIQLMSQVYIPSQEWAMTSEYYPLKAEYFTSPEMLHQQCENGLNEPPPWLS